MVNIKIFFFELNEDYVLFGYVYDDYVKRGQASYIFDLSNTYDAFDFDCYTDNAVFVDSSTSYKWDYEDGSVYGIFDDEQLLKALTTEADEDLVCEDGKTILIW